MRNILSDKFKKNKNQNKVSFVIVLLLRMNRKLSKCDWIKQKDFLNKLQLKMFDIGFEV